MLPSKFVELADFPDRWQERDLQQYLSAVALVSITASQLKREFTDCQQINQVWNCLFSQKRPLS
ncbi:hypothetical protein H6G91_37040 [Nostoc muscorum FACHB-395]|nr:hypothetical protein [Desmonostoc muscorum FACHB-395]